MQQSRRLRRLCSFSGRVNQTGEPTHGIRHSSLAAVIRKEDDMNWDRVEGNWKQFKGKVKEKWGNVNDSDLDKIEGRRDQLEGILQERYGIAKDAAKKDVDDWLKTMH
jgi:uncharacterized protein YjbJ (UPF0337 family)